jgi:serine/threonine protein kinase
MPYESLANKIFSEKSDVFALGVILVEMLTGRVPWQAQSEEELKRKLKNPPPISKQINIKIRDVIFNCLAFQPCDRLTY